MDAEFEVDGVGDVAEVAARGSEDGDTHLADDGHDELVGGLLRGGVVDGGLAVGDGEVSEDVPRPRITLVFAEHGDVAVASGADTLVGNPRRSRGRVDAGGEEETDFRAESINEFEVLGSPAGEVDFSTVDLLVDAGL